MCNIVLVSCLHTKYKNIRHYSLPVLICTKYVFCTTRDDLVEGALKNDAEKNIKN